MLTCPPKFRVGCSMWWCTFETLFSSLFVVVSKSYGVILVKSSPHVLCDFVGWLYFYFYFSSLRTLTRSAVTPMAVTSPPAPAPWIMSGLSPYRFV